MNDVDNEAVAYVRVSTIEQRNSGLSLEAQETRIRAYCTSQGLNLREVITDAAVSATKRTSLKQRRGGQKVLELVDRGYVKHVIATKLDRCFRSTLECLKQLHEWEKQGVSAHFLDLGVNTQTPIGKLFLVIISAVSELEASFISQRTRAALSAKKARGEGRDKLDDPETLDRIRYMVQEGRSYRTMCAILKQEGYKTFKGGPWRVESLRRIVARLEPDK